MGVRAHFQELKNVLRWLLQGQDATWSVPQEPAETIYLKETLGPYTQTEAHFNPLDVLLSAGFPPAKLHVLIVGRTPLNTWASWDHWWRETTKVDHFIAAYETTEQARRRAIQENISMTTLVYEAIKSHPTDTIIQRLFQRLGVSFSPLAVRGWHRLPPFKSPDSNIVFPIEPQPFIVPGIHEPVMSADKLVYTSRENSLPELPPEDVSAIARAGLTDVYETWRLTCQAHLGVEIEADQDWKQVGA